MIEMDLTVTIQTRVKVHLSGADNKTDLYDQIAVEMSRLSKLERIFDPSDAEILAYEIDEEWEEEDDSIYDRAYEEKVGG